MAGSYLDYLAPGYLNIVDQKCMTPLYADEVQVEFARSVIAGVRRRGLRLGFELVTNCQLKNPAKVEKLHLMEQKRDARGQNLGIVIIGRDQDKRLDSGVSTGFGWTQRWCQTWSSRSAKTSQLRAARTCLRATPRCVETW
ncbi:Hypothetical predicted protein [Olea europaea subsp. europaea]|uniref:Uncharacterized protein n=1 Tax=Olea europaea subsp. europaea TaxID=158383 RepID=A0A8S0UN32_OLEEU|nr:Hypothetical predicted protein [Olea europaea subsp. europaea]